MNTTDERYSIWLAQQSHLPFRAYGMDFSKYKCKNEIQSSREQQKHGHVHRAAIPELPKRPVSLSDLYTSTLALEPPSAIQINNLEPTSRFPSHGEPIWSGSSVPTPNFPRLPSPPQIRPARSILCFPLGNTILPSMPLPLHLSSLSDMARFVDQEADRRHGMSCPRYDDPPGELVSGHDLIPQCVLQDENHEDDTLEAFSTREVRKVCDHCREAVSRSLTHHDPSTEIFTSRALCESWYCAPSLAPIGHESRFHDGMPYHRLIKDIDFQDEIFIPHFFDKEPRESNTTSPPMIGVQHPGPHVRDCSCHQRSTTADSAVSFSLSMNGLPVDNWRSRTTYFATACNSNNRSSNTRNDIANTTLICEKENRKREILKLSKWRPTTPTSSVSSQAPTLTDSSPNPSILNNEDSSREPCSAAEAASQIRAKQLEMMAKYGPGIFQPFIPSRVITEEAEAEDEREEDASPPAHSRPSHRHPYRTPLIPHWQNTALWLTGIPATATYHDILTSIRGGRIYICALNPPTAGTHRTAACKLVFFTRAAAEACLERANHSAGGVCVKGVRIRCIWNRILYPEYRQGWQSRVLVIRGEARLMSFEFFEEFFRARFKGDVEARFEIAGGGGEESRGAAAAAGSGGRYRREVKEGERGWKTYVWRFASLRAQAELAKVALEREMGGIFQVEYGTDPCERPW